MVVVGFSFFLIPKIDGETCTTKWVLFKSIWWCLLLTLCTLLSGTSPQRFLLYFYPENPFLIHEHLLGIAGATPTLADAGFVTNGINQFLS